MNICIQCGEDHPDKVIEPDGPFAICPECGHKQSFLQLPLLLVGGASGSGKSSICQFLLGKRQDVIVLEGDLLWREEFNKPDEKYRDFFETWLRLCKNISQAGFPVALFGAGMAVPENIEPCVERRYFAKVHYLALICDEDVLTTRLRCRPAWRRSGDHEFIERNVEFNQWLMENARRSEPPINLLDTTRLSIGEAADEVFKWIVEKFDRDNRPKPSLE